MREELCSQAGDLLQLCPINLNESLELGVWLMPPVELSPSLGSRNRPLSASCWLALRTPQTLCCSVLVCAALCLAALLGAAPFCDVLLCAVSVTIVCLLLPLLVPLLLQRPLRTTTSHHEIITIAI